MAQEPTKRDSKSPNAFGFKTLRRTLSKMSLFERNPPEMLDPRPTPALIVRPWLSQPVTKGTITPTAPAQAAENLDSVPRNDSLAYSVLKEAPPTNEAMPVGFDGESTPSSATVVTNSSPSPSPTMRKASPLPLPAYPTPNAPWQQTTNGVNGASTDSAPAGKTSQVLAKLTGDNDRLRREIKAEKAAKEEAVQQFQALKSRVSRLEDQNGTLSMQFDANESALARKERRLDDLRSTLEEEVARRKRAEEREAEMGRKLGETVSQAAKEVAEAHLAQKAAETAYSTLSKEYSGLERRIQLLRQEMEIAVKRIDDERAVHRKQLMQLEILLDQERQQQEKADRQVQEMATLLRSYQATEENVKRLETEMQNTVHEMRWAIRLQRSRGQNPPGTL